MIEFGSVDFEMFQQVLTLDAATVWGLVCAMVFSTGFCTACIVDKRNPNKIKQR